jgi:hypothetical protein
MTRQSQQPLDELTSNINTNAKRSREKEKELQNLSKENDSKHSNAIRPYLGHGKERKISKRESQKNIPALSPYQGYQGGNMSGCANMGESSHKQKLKKVEMLSKKAE